MKSMMKHKTKHFVDDHITTEQVSETNHIPSGTIFVIDINNSIVSKISKTSNECDMFDNYRSDIKENYTELKNKRHEKLSSNHKQLL